MVQHHDSLPSLNCTAISIDSPHIRKDGAKYLNLLFYHFKILVCADEFTDAFYDAMGPDEEAEESNTSSEDDSEATEKPELYHVSDESGEMQIEKIGEGSFEQDTLLDKVMLNEHDNSIQLQGFRESYAFLCLLCWKF